jgi:hypothetical protein
MLYFCLGLVLQVASLLQSSLQNPGHAFVFTSMHATCPTHLINDSVILLTFSSDSWWSKRYETTHYATFSKPKVTYSLLGLCSFVGTALLNSHTIQNVRHQVSHPYKTRGKIRVYYTVL